MKLKTIQGHLLTRSGCLLLALFGLLEGCGAATRTTRDQDRPALARQGPPPDALDLRLGKVAARLPASEFTALPIVGRGFLVEGESRAHEIALEPASCVTILTVGSVGVRDIDARLYSPDGVVLADDDEPDAQPIVQLCPQGPASRPVRAFFVIKMYAGAGAYRFAALRSSRDALASAVRTLRGEGSSVTERSALDLRLEEVTASLAERGFSARGEPTTAVLGAHESIRIALPTERSVCYTLVVLGGDGVRNTDIVLVDEDSVEVASDVSPSVDAAVQLCAEAEETISAEVRMVAGSGEIRFAVLGAASEAIGGAARLWLGDRRDRPSQLGVDRAAAGAEEELRRTGYTVRRPATTSTRIQQREVQSHTVQATGGQCTAVVAAGGKGLGRMRVSAFDPTGDPSADPAVGAAGAGVRICPARSVSARIDVEAQRGSGEYALVVGSVAAPAPVRSARPILASRLQTLLDQAVAAGYGIVGEVSAGRIPSGGLRQHPAAVTERCVRIVAAADGYDAETRLHLLDASGRRIGADHAMGGGSWIELCDAPSVAANVELRVEHAGSEVEYRLARLQHR